MVKVAFQGERGAFSEDAAAKLFSLESRPSRTKPWEYVFYADFEGHLDGEVYKEAMRELQREVAFVKILGSYPQAA
jgi:prephenate dehydratase